MRALRSAYALLTWRVKPWFLWEANAVSRDVESNTTTVSWRLRMVMPKTCPDPTLSMSPLTVHWSGWV